MRPDDWLLGQLPVVVLEEDDLFCRLVRLFQAMADTVLDQVDTLPQTLDPAVAPPAVVRLMGSWLGLSVDSRLPEDVQRRLVRTYAEQLPWRGTRRALVAMAEALGARDVEIDDGAGVFDLGEAPLAHPHVRIALTLDAGAAAAAEAAKREHDLRAFLRSELPAEVSFELEVRHPAPPDVPTGTPS